MNDILYVILLLPFLAFAVFMAGAFLLTLVTIIYELWEEYRNK